MKVTLENLTKYFGKVVGAEDVKLEIGDGEFVALLGPSGCGKTTTLLMIVGIYKPTRGCVYFDDQLVNDLPPPQRPQCGHGLPELCPLPPHDRL